jgi:hypothetical protein
MDSAGQHPAGYARARLAPSCLRGLLGQHPNFTPGGSTKIGASLRVIVSGVTEPQIM